MRNGHVHVVTLKLKVLFFVNWTVKYGEVCKIMV